MVHSAAGEMSIDWAFIGYALACVLVPVLWGIGVVWVSNRFEGRLFPGASRKRPDRREVPPIEYHI
jgi:hypothetical protein